MFVSQSSELSIASAAAYLYSLLGVGNGAGGRAGFPRSPCPVQAGLSNSERLGISAHFRIILRDLLVGTGKKRDEAVTNLDSYPFVGPC